VHSFGSCIQPWKIWCYLVQRSIGCRRCECSSYNAIVISDLWLYVNCKYPRHTHTHLIVDDIQTTSLLAGAMSVVCCTVVPLLPATHTAVHCRTLRQSSQVHIYLLLLLLLLLFLCEAEALEHQKRAYWAYYIRLQYISTHKVTKGMKCLHYLKRLVHLTIIFCKQYTVKYCKMIK